MIPMAYGNEIKAEALRKARLLERQMMALRRQQLAEQEARARYYGDNLK